MGKFVKFISLILCFLILTATFLYLINRVYKKKTENKYFDAIGDIYGSVEKNKGLVLQQNSLSRADNLLIFGSSELGSVQKPFHPSYFFEKKKDGFQVNLIGRGYTQSIIHAINIGALGSSINGKKAVFIMSPQWFMGKGLETSNFDMNFSELQFYKYMFNNDLDKSLKINLAKRVKDLAGKDADNVKGYCKLYTMDNLGSKIILSLMMPYYKFKFVILSIKDSIKTDKMLRDFTQSKDALPAGKTSFNWNDERNSAAKAGKSEANNNEYLIENGYYNQYIKDKLASYKDFYKDSSFLKSSEFDDLKLFLDTCKEMNVKPLVISVPVHGKWYDYCGFDKKDRDEYYRKVNDIVTSYGFEIADFSKYEYEDYFLKDIMHLGWKGWVYVDEAIDKYYHENK